MKSKKIGGTKRKVDVNSLSEDQVDITGKQLGEKISEIGDNAAKEINVLAEIYGLSARVVIQFFDIKTGNIIN